MLEPYTLASDTPQAQSRGLRKMWASVSLKAASKGPVTHHRSVSQRLAEDTLQGQSF